MAKDNSTIPWWKREAVAAVTILILLVGIFLLLFWMSGEAAYNQSAPSRISN